MSIQTLKKVEVYPMMNTNHPELELHCPVMVFGRKKKDKFRFNVIFNDKKKLEESIADLDKLVGKPFYEVKKEVAELQLKYHQFHYVHSLVETKTSSSMKPQFKDLKFDSEESFNEWLKKSTHLFIHLKDLGQDMQLIAVHETGEILNCDFHAKIYNGKFIDMSRLLLERHLWISGEDDNVFLPYTRLIVEGLENNSSHA